MSNVPPMSDQPAVIRVEFFGIVRQRAGMAELSVPVPQQADMLPLGDVLAVIAERLPQLATECLDGPRPAAGYLACVNGRLFTTDPSMRLQAGDSVQLLSADVGG